MDDATARRLAKAQYADDDDIEIDEDAKVSHATEGATDGGAWVQAWVWIEPQDDEPQDDDDEPFVIQTACAACESQPIAGQTRGLRASTRAYEGGEMGEKGLLVTILRSALGDTTNDGVTGVRKGHKSVLLVGDGVAEVFEENESRPTLRLVRRNLGGEYLHAEPVVQPRGMVGPMFGGNFVHSSDSRFPSRYPIPVHDRFETPEDYELLSR